MDFLSDSMTGSRGLRVFAAVDDFSRLCAALECDVSFPAERVTRILDRAIEIHGKQRVIRTDNGPEFTSHAFDAWCYLHGIEHHFIRLWRLPEQLQDPRKPWTDVGGCLSES